jgi:hypothetical protein
MKFKLNQIPEETRWAIATKGLTAALTAHLNTLHDILGEDKYAEILHQIWKKIGESSAEMVKSLNMRVDNAKSTAEAGATVCICAMGPELVIEELESSEHRTVMKITECPWHNRMKEFRISYDLLSACDTAFWIGFITSLDPNITMKHGKQMHLGDPYCEWIFETKKQS